MKFKLPILITSTTCLTLPIACVTSCGSSDNTDVRFIQSNFYAGIDTTTKLILSSGDNTKFNWYSSNENIATVDSQGEVVGHQIGSTTIMLTTKNDQYIDTCTVTVVGTQNSFKFGKHTISKSGVVFEKYGDTVTYDITKNKLILNNATIKASEIGFNKDLVVVDATQVNFCNFIISFPDNVLSTDFQIELKGENHIINDMPYDKEKKGGIHVGDHNTLTIYGGGSLTFESTEISQFMVYGKKLTFRDCSISNKEYSVYEYGFYCYDAIFDTEFKFTFNGDYYDSLAAISAMNSFYCEGYEPTTNSDFIKIKKAATGIRTGQAYFKQAHVEMDNVSSGIDTDNGVNIEDHSQIKIVAENRGINCRNFATFNLFSGAQVDIKVTKEDPLQAGVECGNCLIEGLGPTVEKASQTYLKADLARGVGLSAFRVTILNFANVALSSDKGSGINVNNSTDQPLRDPAYLNVDSSWLTASGTTAGTRNPGDGSIWGAGYFIMDEKYTKFEDQYETKYHVVTKRFASELPPVFTFLPYGVEEIEIDLDTGLPLNNYLGKISIEPIEITP